MQFYYGNQMPLRVLDETEFWKMQETKHTEVMLEVLPDLEQEFVEALKNWDEVLTTTHQHVKRFTESVKQNDHQISSQLYQQILQLVSFGLQESMAFIRFCQKVKIESQSAADNHAAQIMIDHIINESKHFIDIAQTILSDQN